MDEPRRRPDWLRPTEYEEPREPGGDDEAAGGVAPLPRHDGVSREAVKPQGDRRDRAPMNYRRGRADEILDIDDHDELEE